MTMPYFINSYDIHLGTSWDFVTQSSNTKKIMEYIAEGLVNIASDIEKGKISRKTFFKGNTFYLKESTIERFGFKTRRMNLFETILFAMNYAELCILNSFAKRRIRLIPLTNVMIVMCRADEILQNKKKFEMVLRRLKSSNSKGIEPVKHKTISSSKKIINSPVRLNEMSY